MARLIDKPRLMEKLKSFHDYVRKNNGQIELNREELT